MERTLNFTLEKETKGAVRYSEVDAQGVKIDQQDATVGTLYVRKTALNGVLPQSLDVTLRFHR